MRLSEALSSGLKVGAVLGVVGAVIAIAGSCEPRPKLVDNCYDELTCMAEATRACKGAPFMFINPRMTNEGPKPRKSWSYHGVCTNGECRTFEKVRYDILFWCEK